MNDQWGTALGGAAILLLASFVGAGLLLNHLFLSFLAGSSARARDFERLALAW